MGKVPPSLSIYNPEWKILNNPEWKILKYCWLLILCKRPSFNNKGVQQKFCVLHVLLQASYNLIICWVASYKRAILK